jgi:hypothetical protein
MLQSHELGWIAGTLDAKGSITKKNNQQRATPQMVLYVDSKDRHIVQRLSRYTGTDPAEKQRRTIRYEWDRKGCVEHCPTQHIHINERQLPPMSRWQVTGSSLVVVVYNVLPYITESEKATMFRTAMEEIAATLPLEGQGRNAINNAINRLANLGWQIPNYMYAMPKTNENE